ncbi:MAG: FAD-binding protein [Desulfarculus sp.]|nr:FAD-binding protein [Pseudomonadota bacterium]MBV1714312.1 FAD-binding protein [Desulfarculus sp.]MBU4573238.1 FAD-binding protein [Pseudomonadota bacterium]MBU4596993.1 FAD-binding protein [Pseudomonadota bacterium]MBV1737381.1 FAD-binding protein [Desulfarculus sp.]
MDQRDKEAIREIVGADHFSDELIDLVSYSYDSSDHDHRPDCAAYPADSEQISRIMQLANERGFAVVPRGAGTSLAGSAVPINGGVVLDMVRMNRILDIRIPDRQVVVQPGVVYADLQKALAPLGFCFPPDPASGKVCTLGGNVATNAGGIRGAKYGVTRDYVLALEVVLPDGRIMHTGTKCMKSASGLDLTRMFVGSEGVLGVITEITLKVNPMPTASRTALASFETLRQAGQAVTDIMHSGILPSVLEIMEENTIRVLRENYGADLPDVAALLLVETDGYTDAEAEYGMQKVVAAFDANQAKTVSQAKDRAEAEKLWAIRRAAGSVAGGLRPNNLSEDVTVPISKVPDLLEGIQKLMEGHKYPFVIFGHAGDGNLHPKIMFDGSDPEQVKEVHQIAEQMFKLTCGLGGTLTGEHGIGLAKAPYMRLEHEEMAMEMMRLIKLTLDPNNVLNPGKMALDE